MDATSEARESRTPSDSTIRSESIFSNSLSYTMLDSTPKRPSRY